MRWIEDHDRPLLGSLIAQDDLLFTVMSMTELVVSPINRTLDIRTPDIRTLDMVSALGARLEG